uniref:Uncharacterized protein n=1 Tax=Rhizophora mucronata TaxID=61149 RepID=A0A2P2JQF0_RHIMU
MWVWIPTLLIVLILMSMMTSLSQRLLKRSQHSKCLEALMEVHLKQTLPMELHMDVHMKQTHWMGEQTEAHLKQTLWFFRQQKITVQPMDPLQRMKRKRMRVQQRQI